MQDARQNLAQNIRTLRAERRFSQQRLADLSGIPRPTVASLESGKANPTLAVLNSVADGLNVSIEELIGPTRSDFEFIPANSSPQKRKQGGVVRPLVPESIPGLEITRTELAPGGSMTGVPHKPGTREYLTCERGQVELVAAGQHHRLQAGDTLVFRGDQRHSYINPDKSQASVSFSVVCFSSR